MAKKAKRPAYKTKNKAAEAYERLKLKARERIHAISRAARDIAPLPSIVNPVRRRRTARSFRFFCERYFPATFNLPWSPDHLRIIDKIEQAVLKGGLFAVATPRGFGKTSLCEVACIWAALYGYQEFICLIGADEAHAIAMLDSIKKELQNNELLLQDFPESIYPIHRLEGIAHRATGQLYRGKRTQIVWTSKEIVFPTIPGSPASGVVIKVAGITGSFRGMKFKRADGKTVRPTLVVIDDPQTDESARSPSQSAAREAILSGAILGLAGPGRKIAGIMPCTVIAPGDMADNILDRSKHPDWNGERIKLLYKFPDNMELWERYAEIRAESFRRGGRGEEATEFYRQNREEMDRGAVASWPERYNYDELSAIQHAMNLYFQDREAFFAEYQNEPIRDDVGKDIVLPGDLVPTKLNRYARGVVPVGATRLTAFIDVHQAILFYAVTAWAEDFTGFIIDYGTFPRQSRSYFTMYTVSPKLSSVTRTGSMEGDVYAGLSRLTELILGRSWKRDDGAELRIERCLIDANWGQCTELVYQFCRESPFAAVLMPSHGKFVGASSRPLSEYRRLPGDRVGLNWRIPNVQGRRSVRYCLFDSNFWKTFLTARLATAMGSPGCLSIFGTDPDQHRLLIDHLLSEQPIRVEARGRVVEEWRMRAPVRDNHWLDCLVGCLVAASIQGVSTLVESQKPTAAKTRISFAALQRAKRAAHR